MSRIIHLCLDIAGALRWPKRQLARMFRDEAGRYIGADAARDHLIDQLAMGRKVLPMCDCADFDYQLGCPGKEVHE